MAPSTRPARSGSRGVDARRVRRPGPRWQAVRTARGVRLGRQESLAEPARLLLARARRARESLAVAAARVSGACCRRRETAIPQDAASVPAIAAPTCSTRDTRTALCAENLVRRKVDALIELAQGCTARTVPSATAGWPLRLLRFLAAYGAAHPASYRRLRAFLVRMSRLRHALERRQQAAESAASALQQGFRDWLGPTRSHRGRSRDRRGVPLGRRGRLRRRGAARAIARECSPRSRSTADPPRSGLPVLQGHRDPTRATSRRVGSGSACWARGTASAVYRSRSRPASRVLRPGGQRQSRADPGAGRRGDPLADPQRRTRCDGNRWSRNSAATGRSRTCGARSSSPARRCERALRRLAKREDESERSGKLWPFLAWTALSGYVDFWNRTGRALGDRRPGHVQRGRADRGLPHRRAARLALARAGPSRGLLAMMRSFMRRVHPAREVAVPGPGGPRRLGHDLLVGAGGRRRGRGTRACYAKPSNSARTGRRPDAAAPLESYVDSGAGARIPAPPPVLRRQAVPPLGPR